MRNKLLLRLIPDEILSLQNGGISNFIQKTSGISKYEYVKAIFRKKDKK